MLIGVLDFEEFPLECQPSSKGEPARESHTGTVSQSSLAVRQWQQLLSNPHYYLVGVYIKEFKCTISSSDVLPSSPSDNFDSAGVDLCRLPENLSLGTCKFSMRAFEAFRFRGMAENEDDKCFQGHNQHDLEVQILLHLYLSDKNKITRVLC